MKTHTDINKTIGTRIAALRTSRGLTAAELADKAGDLTVWKLSRYERGTSDISAAALVRVAAALDVTSAVLTGEEKFSEYMARLEEAHGARAGAE
jgi:transcriptional regulator with XRE-family HTH domain